MAMNAPLDAAGTCPETESLKCPLCFGVFEDATLLTCGHSFCQRCLKNWDKSHEDQDHMVCPICRNVTSFQDGRVAVLPRNVSINALVEELTCNAGGPTAILEAKQKCTSCQEGQVAISFCCTCSVYLCDLCTKGHKRMQSFFKGHQIVTMQDIEEGKVSIKVRSNRCSEHPLETRDLFCEKCTVHICMKCALINHQDHKMKSQRDFEAEMQQKVHYLTQCYESKKESIEKNICHIEHERQEVQCTLKKLRGHIKETYDVKSTQMKDHELDLLQKVDSFQTELCSKLDNVKVSQTQMIKQMRCMLEIVQHDRLADLELDSLVAHTQVCADFKNALAKPIDEDSARHIKEMAQRTAFNPAEDDLLSVGEVEMRSNTLPCTVEAALLGVNKTLAVLREVDLPQWMYGMAALSQEKVAIGYGWYRHGSDSFCLSGEKLEYLKPEVGPVWDIAVLGDGSSVVSHGTDMIKVYTPDRSKPHRHLPCKSNFYFKVGTDGKQNVYTVNGTNRIYRYKASPRVHRNKAKTPKITRMTTGDVKPRQVSIAKSGTIITSNSETSPSMVTVFDEEGKIGSCLKSNNPDEYLYAAVAPDERVFVARVAKSTLTLSAYELEDTNLTKETEFRGLKLPDLHPWWCYLVCLSSQLLAFASNKRLYFIKIPS